MSEDSGTQDLAPDSGPKELREALKRAEARNAELEGQVQTLTDAARAQAFSQAGVPEDKWGAAFRSTYDGPIKAQVIEWGVLPNQEPAQPEPGTVVQSGDPIVPTNPDLGALASIQEVRGTDAAPDAGSQLLSQLQKMQASGEYTQADVTKVLADHGLLRNAD